MAQGKRGYKGAQQTPVTWRRSRYRCFIEVLPRQVKPTDTKTKQKVEHETVVNPSKSECRQKWVSFASHHRSGVATRHSRENRRIHGSGVSGRTDVHDCDFWLRHRRSRGFLEYR